MDARNKTADLSLRAVDFPAFARNPALELKVAVK
jgi:hypothetical protein